jgi:DNA-binding CsgD family transcriptional regulator
MPDFALEDFSDDVPVFYNDYVALWQSVNQKIPEEDQNSKYESLSEVFSQYAALNKQFISIFNTKTQQVEFMSENYLEVLGYTCTTEEYKKYSTLYWMRDMPLKQSWFFMQMSLFFRNTVQDLLKNAAGEPSIKWYLHNFKLSPPKKENRHISLTCSGLEYLPNGNMSLMMLAIKEVSMLVKENSPWCAEFVINGNTTYSYHEKTKKFEKRSLFSFREKEILSLVKSGFDTKQIAEKLSLSTYTIETHRKNMIELVGAKDFSSLIQICNLGNLAEH